MWPGQQKQLASAVRAVGLDFILKFNESLPVCAIRRDRLGFCAAP